MVVGVLFATFCAVSVAIMPGRGASGALVLRCKTSQAGRRVRPWLPERAKSLETNGCTPYNNYRYTAASGGIGRFDHHGHASDDMEHRMEGMTKTQRAKLDRLVRLAGGNVELVRRALSQVPASKAGVSASIAERSRSLEDVEAYLRKELSKAA